MVKAAKTPPREGLTEYQADQLDRLRRILATRMLGMGSDQRTDTPGLVVSCALRSPVPAVWLELRDLGHVTIGDYYGLPTVIPVSI